MYSFYIRKNGFHLPRASLNLSDAGHDLVPGGPQQIFDKKVSRSYLRPISYLCLKSFDPPGLVSSSGPIYFFFLVHIAFHEPFHYREALPD